MKKMPKVNVEKKKPSFDTKAEIAALKEKVKNLPASDSKTQMLTYLKNAESAWEQVSTTKNREQQVRYLKKAKQQLSLANKAVFNYEQKSRKIKQLEDLSKKSKKVQYKEKKQQQITESNFLKEPEQVFKRTNNLFDAISDKFKIDEQEEDFFNEEDYEVGSEVENEDENTEEFENQDNSEQFSKEEEKMLKEMEESIDIKQEKPLEKIYEKNINASTVEKKHQQEKIKNKKSAYNLYSKRKERYRSLEKYDEIENAIHSELKEELPSKEKSDIHKNHKENKKVKNFQKKKREEENLNENKIKNEEKNLETKSEKVGEREVWENIGTLFLEKEFKKPKNQEKKENSIFENSKKISSEEGSKIEKLQATQIGVDEKQNEPQTMMEKALEKLCNLVNNIDKKNGKKVKIEEKMNLVRTAYRFYEGHKRLERNKQNSTLDLKGKFDALSLYMNDLCTLLHDNGVIDGNVKEQYMHLLRMEYESQFENSSIENEFSKNSDATSEENTLFDPFNTEAPVKDYKSPKDESKKENDKNLSKMPQEEDELNVVEKKKELLSFKDAHEKVVEFYGTLVSAIKNINDNSGIFFLFRLRTAVSKSERQMKIFKDNLSNAGEKDDLYRLESAVEAGNKVIEILKPFQSQSLPPKFDLSLFDKVKMPVKEDATEPLDPENRIFAMQRHEPEFKHTIPSSGYVDKDSSIEPEDFQKNPKSNELQEFDSSETYDIPFDEDENTWLWEHKSKVEEEKEEIEENLEISKYEIPPGQKEIKIPINIEEETQDEEGFKFPHETWDFDRENKPLEKTKSIPEEKLDMEKINDAVNKLKNRAAELGRIYFEIKNEAALYENQEEFFDKIENILNAVEKDITLNNFSLAEDVNKDSHKRLRYAIDRLNLAQKALDEFRSYSEFLPINVDSLGLPKNLREEAKEYKTNLSEDKSELKNLLDKLPKRRHKTFAMLHLMREQLYTEIEKEKKKEKNENLFDAPDWVNGARELLFKASIELEKSEGGKYEEYLENARKLLNGAQGKISKNRKGGEELPGPIAKIELPQEEIFTNEEEVEKEETEWGEDDDLLGGMNDLENLVELEADAAIAANAAAAVKRVVNGIEDHANNLSFLENLDLDVLLSDDLQRAFKDGNARNAFMNAFSGLEARKYPGIAGILNSDDRNNSLNIFKLISIRKKRLEANLKERRDLERSLNTNLGKVFVGNSNPSSLKRTPAPTPKDKEGKWTKFDKAKKDLFDPTGKLKISTIASSKELTPGEIKQYNEKGMEIESPFGVPMFQHTTGNKTEVSFELGAFDNMLTGDDQILTEKELWKIKAETAALYTVLTARCGGRPNAESLTFNTGGDPKLEAVMMLYADFLNNEDIPCHYDPSYGEFKKEHPDACAEAEKFFKEEIQDSSLCTGLDALDSVKRVRDYYQNKKNAELLEQDIQNTSTHTSALRVRM